MASVLYFLFLSPSSPIPFDARNACRSASVRLCYKTVGESSKENESRIDVTYKVV